MASSSFVVPTVLSGINSEAAADEDQSTKRGPPCPFKHTSICTAHPLLSHQKPFVIDEFLSLIIYLVCNQFLFNISHPTHLCLFAAPAINNNNVNFGQRNKIIL